MRWIVAGLLVFSNSASFANRVDVHFDHTFYTLDFQEKRVVYQEFGRSHRVACDKEMIENLRTTHRDLLDDFTRNPASLRTEYDVKVSTEGKVYSVPRGSEYGTWLRNMPQEILYLAAHAGLKCKSSH